MSLFRQKTNYNKYPFFLKSVVTASQEICRSSRLTATATQGTPVSPSVFYWVGCAVGIICFCTFVGVTKKRPMIYNLGNRVVNNYLVSLDGGEYVLIDTGYADGFERFTKKLEETGVTPKEIKYVFLTHAHDDHAGFLNDVLAFTDAKVILHPMAIDRLHRGQNSFQGGCSSRQAWLFCQILALFGKGEHKYPPIKEAYLSRLISIDSDAFKALALPLEVVKTPGRTADHISMLKDGILFCGDAAMNNFPSIKRTIIWVENLEQYKQSWEKMIALNPKIIYPSPHGKSFPTKDLVKFQSYLDVIRLYSL